MQSWETSQHSLLDTGKTRKTCAEVNHLLASTAVASSALMSKVLGRGDDNERRVKNYTRFSKFVKLNVRDYHIFKPLLRSFVRPRGRRVGFSHSPAIAQIALSSVTLCLKPSEVPCIRASCNAAFIQRFN